MVLSYTDCVNLSFQQLKTAKGLLGIRVGIPSRVVEGGGFGFSRIVGAGVPERRMSQRIGEILLLYEVAGGIMGIEIAFVVAHIGHKLCGRIADVEWRRLVAGLAHEGYGLVKGHIG